MSERGMKSTNPFRTEKENDARFVSSSTNPFVSSSERSKNTHSGNKGLAHSRSSRNFNDEANVSEKYPEQRRHKTHHHHHRSSKDNTRLDTIDKLDVTGIFSQAGFHHDGPFDAARPQRNRRNDKNAPVLAFPMNGENSSLTRPRLQNSTKSFSSTSDDSSSSVGITRRGTVSGQFDSATRSRMVHSQSTAGLGSSTFLDGAPASQEAVREDIRTRIRRNQTVKANRRKSIGDMLRAEFIGTQEEKVGDAPKRNGSKLLRRVKSLKTRNKS
ncbi:Pal2p KNAG_0B04360 [Huiozyma naganishii CBS 8797]|uniref:Uncharacterized protein n=1 Tax=Huiozyma naganishii (strain ATCC MYA-139 / BCRC 22969 / CBS 8797 / KCTC 17520 / NBRC 10181 / NCYC 3082 / Yp74L-3) TaxID=1071383 RepID=J7R227_HUIN7|nr:hypothetical protein KNAG_0B04360 [Kazachstania naganishii CBS 8797]CCK68870.1 hypothetical protein KNAG_0B04360 [Kazachstania naganishii CBS 8797]